MKCQVPFKLILYLPMPGTRVLKKGRLLFYYLCLRYPLCCLRQQTRGCRQGNQCWLKHILPCEFAQCFSPIMNLREVILVASDARMTVKHEGAGRTIGFLSRSEPSWAQRKRPRRPASAPQAWLRESEFRRRMLPHAGPLLRQRLESHRRRHCACAGPSVCGC